VTVNSRLGAGQILEPHQPVRVSHNARPGRPGRALWL